MNNLEEKRITKIGHGPQMVALHQVGIKITLAFDLVFKSLANFMKQSHFLRT
jgi:hypothetical protein